MKNLILSFLVVLCVLKAVSQNAPDLKFDQNFTACEKKWVVFERDPTWGYPYGFVYIDMTAGFTFDLKGFITVLPDGKFMADSTVSKNGFIKHRLGPGTKNVALLPANRIQELNLPSQPYWLEGYYSTVPGSLYYNYRMGWVYNAAGASAIALKYLEKANSEDDQVRFEMIFAYNATGRFDDAIKMLETDIKNKPDNINLYKELGYAYGGAKKFDKAIEAYGKGLLLFTGNARSEERGEMALNTALTYMALSNREEYNKWMRLAKDYYPVDSPTYKRIVASGF